MLRKPFQCRSLYFANISKHFYNNLHSDLVVSRRLLADDLLKFLFADDATHHIIQDRAAGIKLYISCITYK
jgi:hypothetical protein